jgi:hypothetical protein
MSLPPLRSLDSGLYRAALWLCPSGFRREYADEMSRDFDEARDEASTRGAGGLWWLRLVMTVDLVRTAVVQWARSGLPVIAVISVVAALALAEGLATLARYATFQTPSDPAHGEMMGIVLVATTSVFLIATTIALTLWAVRPIRRGRR